MKRHFRELGIDIMSTPFTVVGDRRHVGRRVRQRDAPVAVHQARRRRSTTGTCSSIPIPDPTVSFEERRRLFDLPGSSWNDYDRTKMSPGGDIFDRKAKSVTPSPAGPRRDRHPRRRARRT